MPIEEIARRAMGSFAAESGRRAAVISLHFSAAHASHMIAIARLLGELGFAVTFILDQRYLTFANFAAVGETICSRDAKKCQSKRFDLAVFCNSALGNRRLASSLRAQGSSVVYIFHEPESIANLRHEGWRQVVRFPFSTYCSIATLRLSSAVIVPSACAGVLYQQHFLSHNHNVHIMPLLFEDEIEPSLLDQMRDKKRFFGFAGTACKSHGFDAFIAFAKYAIANGSSIPFTIATKVDLARTLRADRELSRLVKSGRIEMQHGRVLSNDEINGFYLKSFCVWNVYRRSTQSGVLPRAFMAGTPVLASRIGSFPEYLREGTTGEFVESPDDPATILEVVERIRENIQEYVDPCRTAFLQTFHFRANGNRLATILESVSPGLPRMRVD